jgi:hypothetical protein
VSDSRARDASARRPSMDAGRAGTVAQLRSLADRIEHLAITDVAQVLVLLEPVLDDLRRQATLALERAPGGS